MLWDFPVELWLACWLHCSKRQLRRLSLVCKHFRSICLPLLIQHQSADMAALDSGLAQNNWVERTHSLHRMAVRLDRFGAQGPEGLASVVRSWMITRVPSHWIIHHRRHLGPIVHINVFDTLQERVMTTFLTTIGLFQHLRRIHVAGMTVDLTWRERLLSLSSLQELTLDGCEILPREGPVLRLSRFTHCQSTVGHVAPSEEPFEIVDPSTLTHLNLRCPVQSRNLLAGFVDATFTSLLSLSLHHFPVRDIPSLLLRCPKLQSLSVLSLALDDPVELPGHIAPALSTLTAEAQIAPLFSANHRIHTVEIVNSRREINGLAIDTLRDVLSTLGNASSRITSLMLPKTTSTVAAVEIISAVLPQLKHLAMDLPESDGKHQHINICRLAGGVKRAEDNRRPDVDDDESAFDDVLPDELSDCESDRPHNRGVVSDKWYDPVWLWGNIPANFGCSQHSGVEDPDPLPESPSGTYTDLLRRIASDLVDFPPGLESLKLTPLLVPEREQRHRCYDAQEESAAAALVARGLWNVTLGERVWRGNPGMKQHMS
ncbi:hypothetical protein FB45DRAFT_48321 [Roridomyces roridus]|uniref:F-box domain-containing protein n=1 Tax=Roridomyces roridus TaxID=1738132 RepID=A0AAD7FKI8_9AGAR|nr:hypothetical protein FB45DRAFT_48321 [Roridomyces roridus]